VKKKTVMNSTLQSGEENLPTINGKLRNIIRVANITIAATWIYHGLIPKLLHMETGELSMITSCGMFNGVEREMVYALGIAEIIFGLMMLFFGKFRLVHWLSIAGLLLLAIGAVISKPGIYIEPFNPATTEFGVIGLSVVVLIIGNKNRQHGK
jgi:hypothetical protein